MPRMMPVQEEELLFLRKSLTDRFLEHNPDLTLPKFNAYLPNYVELRDGIVNKVLSASASLVSLHRLRKLYYYTDGERCGPDQYQEPSFNIEFLDLCYLYLTDNEKDRAGYFQSKNITTSRPDVIIKRDRFLLLAIPTTLIFGLLIINLLPGRPSDFEELFIDNTAVYLKEKSWEYLHPVPAYSAKQEKDSVLSLYTLPGDFWVKENEEPRISNLLVKKINCSCCIISSRITGFNPTQNWQQAGLFIFNGDLSPANHFRLTLAYADGGPGTGMHKIQGVQMENGGAIELKSGLIARFDKTTASSPEDLWLQIKADPPNYTFYYAQTYRWRGFQKLDQVVSGLQPKYIGLAAFQGLTDNQGEPLGAEVLPVYFDMVKVQPCLD